MAELKRQSMDTHQLWVACGRPRSGPMYTARCRARRAIKYKTQIANTHISNDLHDQLLSKDCASFWTTWKTKVNKRHTAANDVDGCTNATDIANSFASRFQQACLPNSSDYSEKLKDIFEEKFCRYQPDSKLQWISVETVDKCIGDMKLQKAAGVDGIQ